MDIQGSHLGWPWAYRGVQILGSEKVDRSEKVEVETEKGSVVIGGSLKNIPLLKGSVIPGL